MKIRLNRDHKINILVFLFFLSVAFLLLFPAVLFPQNKIIDDYDGLLITWILNRVQDNLLSGRHLFSANIFFPYQNALAFSDLLFTDAVLTLPLKIISKEPLVIYNAVQVLDIVFTAYFSFLLINYLAKSYFSGILAGIFASFSGFHLHYLGHLQVLNYYYLPLFLLLILKWEKEKNNKWLVFAAFSFILQSANSFFAGYLIVIAFLVLLIVDKSIRIRLLQEKYLAIVLMLASLMFLSFFVIPYINFSREFGVVRSLREAANFSLGIEEVFTKFKIIILSVIFVWSLLCFRINKNDILNRYFSALGLTGIILSLGPVLKFLGKTVKIPFPIPLPYMVFYYLFPGFMAFRTPSRWFILTGFALSLFLAVQLGKLFKGKKIYLKIFMILSLFFLVILESGFPFKFKTLPATANYPAIYHKLSAVPQNNGILELPAYDYTNVPFAGNEVYRMVYSLSHRRNLFNGYSGYFPNYWLVEINVLRNNFPDAKTLKLLKARKIGYVIVHRNEYNLLAKIWNLSWERKLGEIENNPDLELVAKEGNDYLYKIKFTGPGI